MFDGRPTVVAPTGSNVRVATAPDELVNDRSSPANDVSAELVLYVTVAALASIAVIKMPESILNTFIFYKPPFGIACREASDTMMSLSL
jgi:hypothetical protein